MTLQKAIASLALLCAGAACAPVPDNSPSVAQASQLSFIGDPQLVGHSRITLGESAQRAFEQFRTEPHAFGAMYVRPDGEGWRWYSDVLTIEAAKQMAKTGCDVSTGSNCVLYATLEPSTPAAEIAVPQRVRQRILDAKSENSAGGYLVVAANQASDLGYSWNYNSQSEARSAALRQCELAAKDGLARRVNDDVEARVDIDLKKTGFFDCKILGIYR